MKHAMNLFLMIAVTFFFYFVILSVVEEQYILPNTITPLAGVRLDQWLSSFRLWGGIGIFTALGASILWYALAQWVFRINRLSDVRTRGIWFLLTLLPIAVIVLAFIFTRQAQVGMWVAYTLYVVNALLCYNIATVFFSPSSHKYIPPLASILRRW